MHLDSATARDHAAELHALRAAAEKRTQAAKATAATRTAAARPAAPVMVVQFGGLALRPLQPAAADRQPVRARPPERWPAPTRLPRVTA